ncbi:MAG: glycogen/starch synthase, partial [Phycisphaerae bacterium]
MKVLMLGWEFPPFISGGLGTAWYGLTKAMSRLGTETAFEVLAKARRLEAEGLDVIHLEIGEPDFDTPANI